MLDKTKSVVYSMDSLKELNKPGDNMKLIKERMRELGVAQPKALAEIMDKIIADNELGKASKSGEVIDQLPSKDDGATKMVKVNLTIEVPACVVAFAKDMNAHEGIAGMATDLAATTYCQALLSSRPEKVELAQAMFIILATYKELKKKEEMEKLPSVEETVTTND